MRFKFEGRWEAQALISFCEQYGVKSLAGINLYFNMYDEANNELEINAPDGQTMAGLAFKNSNLPKGSARKRLNQGLSYLSSQEIVRPKSDKAYEQHRLPNSSIRATTGRKIVISSRLRRQYARWNGYVVRY